MNRLCLATRNPGKLRELEALLEGVGLELIGAQDLEGAPHVEETGADYAANAALKARSVAACTGLWTLADDTGLEVEALGGAPGLHSSRYAGPGGGDEDRRRKLLEALSPYPRPWIARFVCVVALSSPAGEVEFAEGECRGEIIPGERGQGGFGYDPIFLIQGYGKTMAELELEAKNRISHRARAVRAILPRISERLTEDCDPCQGR
jgi:XTP/dITP diphosphohydrolase